MGVKEGLSVRIGVLLGSVIGVGPSKFVDVMTGMDLRSAEIPKEQEAKRISWKANIGMERNR